MTTESSCKRRRVVAGNASSSGVVKIDNLPIEPLTCVANFLSLPSRAMFAVALATTHFSDNGSYTESSRKIIGDRFDTLDFGQIEKGLAAKLNDNDIHDILRCVDAVNKLKILRLTNCVNISGAGLEPLRGSAIIERINLTTVAECEDQRSRPELPISCELVLPILDTIIVEGSAMKHLQFPRHWHVNEPIDSDVYQFLDRFNHMLHDRGLYRCLKCNRERETDETFFSLWGNGIQVGTCIACLKHYCKSCSEIYDCIECQNCRMIHCSDCSLHFYCGSCYDSFCVQCITPARCSGSECDEDICDTCRFHCQNCHRPYCAECHIPNKCDVCHHKSCSECTAYLECEDCYFGHCVGCVKNAGINEVHSCEDCGRQQCISCRLRRPYPVDRSCSGCFNIIAKPWVRCDR